MLRFEVFQHSESLAQQRELFRDCFPETEGSAMQGSAHYHWKFHQFPDARPSSEYAAWDQDQLVGYYAAIPYRYRVFGEPARSAMVCDVMTHSSARGKGIFTKLGAFSVKALSDEGWDFSIGYPIRPEVVPGHLKVGWKVAFELPMYLKPLRTNRLLASKNLQLLAPLANLGCWIFNLLTRGQVASGYVARTLSIQDLVSHPGLSPFVENWQSSLPISLDKSAAFLQWRLGAPESRYQATIVEREQRIVALAITRTCELKGIPALAVLDFMVTPGEDASLGALHRELERFAGQESREAVCGIWSRTWAARYRLSRHGFLRTPFVFRVILRPLARAFGDEFFRESNWHLMWLDSDDL